MAISRNGKQVYVAASDGDTVAVFERDRTTGALTQFPAPDGCIAENGDGVTCTDAIGLDGPASIAISRTGRQVYVASVIGNTIAIFARNAATGVLTQLAAPAGCVSAMGDGVTCSDANAMFGPTSIALTSNGRHAYVTAANSSAVVVFARDKKTGALTQLAAPNGCMANTGDGITCIKATAVAGAYAVAMPKNARHVYVASYSGGSIAAFEREP
jgi:6-phosphogluconolactonase (cycloisomerase 2 family)